MPASPAAFNRRSIRAPAAHDERARCRRVSYARATRAASAGIPMKKHRAQREIQLPEPDGAAAMSEGAPESRPGAEQVTSWLLEGRFFTIDPAGAITSWSPPADETFGWRRRDAVGAPFADTLLAPEARQPQSERIAD